MRLHRIIALAVTAVIILTVTFTTSANTVRFSMSYLYGNYNYSSLVDRTKGALNEVSPSWFDLNTDGSLHLNIIDTDFVADMHTKGVKVVPFLSNHWNRTKGRAALSNMNSLSNQISAAISNYNLDGINVDIENLNGLDTANYTAFVGLLRQKIGLEKTLAVAVAANPYNWTRGWQASYDYSALAQYADYLMIMAYDEHYESGEAGPVASIGFVEKSIQYALKYVSKDKVVLGIPFYGRYWQNGASYGGYGASLSTIVPMLSSYESTLTYDETSKSAKAVITIKTTDTKPVIGYRTLSAGTYTFWYENEDSLKAKLSLIDKYDIYGVGSWSLGQETADTWDYYSDTLNGTPEETTAECTTTETTTETTTKTTTETITETTTEETTVENTTVAETTTKEELTTAKRIKPKVKSLTEIIFMFILKLLRNLLIDKY